MLTSEIPLYELRRMLATAERLAGPDSSTVAVLRREVLARLRQVPRKGGAGPSIGTTIGVATPTFQGGRDDD